MEELAQAPAVARSYGYADARLGVDQDASHDELAARRLEEPFSRCLSRLGPDAGHQDGELITAEADEGVTWARARPQPQGQLAEQLVARDMA